MCDEQNESSPVKKDLAFLVVKKLDKSWQCSLASQKVNCILTCIKRNLARSLREGILPLYSSLIKTPTWSLALDPQQKKDLAILQWIEKSDIKKVKVREHVSYEEMLEELELFRLDTLCWSYLDWRSSVNMLIGANFK